MEGLYDVVFTFRDKIVFKIDGVSSLADAISSILESTHLMYEIVTIYGYEQKGLRYIVHKKEQHFRSDIEYVA